MQWVPFWPRDASVTGHVVDTLFIGELALSLLILAAVYGLMFVFCARYWRGRPADRSDQVRKTWKWEIGWTSATFVGFLVLFVWGANAYVYLFEPPAGARTIYVVAKQWMWKAEHPGGQREIDALHVPLGRKVRLLMTSEDVIHSFFVPAFRVKHDVLPGQYETLWFQPTETGTFRLECTQYCGTQHAHMTGAVIVMTPADYGRWLADQGVHRSLARQGEALFRKFGCSGCHDANSTVHAPSLAGLYGTIVHLQSGETMVANATYIRDCILFGAKRIVPAGYPPIMPSFAGQLGEDDLIKLIAYIQSLSGAQGAAQ